MKTKIARDRIKESKNYGNWYVCQGDIFSGLYLSNKTGDFRYVNNNADDFYFKTRELAREALANYKGLKTQTKKPRAVTPKVKLFTMADRKEALEKLKDKVEINTFTQGTVLFFRQAGEWLCKDGQRRGVCVGQQHFDSYYYKTLTEAEDALLKYFNVPVIQPKVFGYSYLLDMYDCAPGVADDMELTYRFLETLVDKLGMTRMSQPFVIHGPTKDGVELYPDKAGVSAWVPLIESGVQIHSLEPTHFITLDCYSCKHFDKNVVLEYARECFKFKKHEEHWLERGKQYAT